MDVPPPPAADPAAPADAFARDLARSGLAAPGRVAELWAGAPAAARRRPAALADHLVAAGELTRFQADKLLRGHWRGIVLGPYRLLCPLGRGGMGVVYLARAGAPAGPAAGPLVALKVLPPDRARAEPRTLARFVREIEVGRRLPAHPHLTRTLDAGVASGAHYLTMEYVPGKTVRQAVADAGPMPVGAAARAFADVAAGLQAAHAAGFVHRDLKPANVVVTPAGRAKVLDFGFALMPGDPAGADPAALVGPGYTLGTMDYLAPEQADDPAGVGPAADLYAVGCSLYYAVAGCPPFPGGTPQDKIRWQRTAAPPPVTQLNPAVPPAFAGLIARLMAKRPADRPGSAAEAADLLAGWAAPVPAGPATAGGPAERIETAETTWRAEHPDDPAVDESLVLVAGRPADPWAVRVPGWVVGFGLAAAGAAVAAAGVLGWAVARSAGR